MGRMDDYFGKPTILNHSMYNHVCKMHMTHMTHMTALPDRSSPVTFHSCTIHQPPRYAQVDHSASSRNPLERPVAWCLFISIPFIWQFLWYRKINYHCFSLVEFHFSIFVALHYTPYTAGSKQANHQNHKWTGQVAVQEWATHATPEFVIFSRFLLQKSRSAMNA